MHVVNFIFVCPLGNFPQIEVVAVYDNPTPAVSRTENTKGSPDMNTVALELEGAVSMPFSLATLDAGKVCVVLYFQLLRNYMYCQNCCRESLQSNLLSSNL